MKTAIKGTKERICDAAISLFTSQGFKGTTIRQIAQKANVNIALVSYHFGGKKGLLEELVMSFYEGYVRRLEVVYHTSTKETAKGTLIELTEQLLSYQKNNLELARFVHREMTLDSTLIRELMSTYLAKEKYYLNAFFEKGMKRREFKRQSVDLLSVQYKEMLLLPFLQPLYLTEVFHLPVGENIFYSDYQKWIRSWIEKFVCVTEKKPSILSNVLFGAVQEKWGG
ncbi:forespore capture DNA-binding protein RefZ [Fictibacillus iocasae]|uniref:Forespore capture DNA-binding protein RefZ n=1 Tax=Fictibacillus iocasae TaxID=2715437 RepID=A0ABW2NSA7_9BACL